MQSSSCVVLIVFLGVAVSGSLAVRGRLMFEVDCPLRSLNLVFEVVGCSRLFSFFLLGSHARRSRSFDVRGRSPFEVAWCWWSLAACVRSPFEVASDYEHRALRV